MSGFKKSPPTEYRKFRVRGHIRSFRDLEVYKQTTTLSAQIFEVDLPPKLLRRTRLDPELGHLRQLSKQIPRLLAESYGNRFTDRELAYDKLEKAMEIIGNVIAKTDFLTTSIDDYETKQSLLKLIPEYQRQKQKILNLKKAWLRFDEKTRDSQPTNG